MRVTLKYDLLTVFVGLSFEIGIGNGGQDAMPRLDALCIKQTSFHL